MLFKLHMKLIETGIFQRRQTSVGLIGGAFLILYAVITILNLWLRSTIPTLAAINSPHDDLLGIQIAKSLIDGNWLGNWDNRTLAKPPGYSFYLSIAHFIPLQLVVVNQIMFCSLAFILIRMIRKHLFQPNKTVECILVLVYAYLIFDPRLFSLEMSRVYRTSLHSIGVFAFCIIFLSIVMSIKKTEIKIKSIKLLSIKSKFILLFSSYSILILLRSESYWILISAIPFLLVTLILLYPEERNQKKNKLGLTIYISKIAILSIVVYVIPISLIGQINNGKYGTTLIENYYSGYFAKAVKDWQKVESGKDARPYIIVSTEQLEAVYKISPTASLLRKALSVEPGTGWLEIPCNSPIKLCDNAGGWFTWQLRDAAMSTGLITSEVDFQEFFKRISNDIEKACDTGTLECGRTGLGVGAKPISELPMLQILSFSLDNFRLNSLVNPDGGGVIATPDEYGASQSVEDTYKSVVNYSSQSNRIDSLVGNSRVLEKLEQVYFPIQVFFIILAILGYALGWKNRERISIYLTLMFSAVAVALNSVGVAVAQISFGWFVQGPYMLPTQFILQFAIVVGIFSLILNIERMSSRSPNTLKNLFKVNSYSYRNNLPRKFE